MESHIRKLGAKVLSTSLRLTLKSDGHILSAGQNESLNKPAALLIFGQFECKTGH